jgi:predicted ArsR family transcriptional regulator
LAAALLRHIAGAGGDPRAAAASAGEDWGRRLAAAAPASGPVETVVAALDGLGFDPQPRPDVAGVTEVHLRACPFLSLVEQDPDAMCALHAGVIEGALRQAGAPAAGAVLVPFGAPDACVARLDTRPAPR